VTRTRRQRPRRRETSPPRERPGPVQGGVGVKNTSPRHAVVARVVRTDPSAHAFPAALQPAPHTRAVAAIHVAELDLLIARKSNLRLTVGKVVHCSKSNPLMSALGQSRHNNTATASPDVRFAPENGQFVDDLGRSAKCQKATFALQQIYSITSSASASSSSIMSRPSALPQPSWSPQCRLVGAAPCCRRQG
jgi:hypothetical protein